jgi:hypothetical protein
MKVHLCFLRQAVGFRALLQNDGWLLEQEKDASLLAWHPEAPDEVTARSRLHQLGLLTSGSLRIEFRPLH